MPFSLVDRSAFVLISAAFLISLPLPALSVAGGPTVSGLDILLGGWQGVRAGVPAWLANPVFVMAVALGAVGRTRSGLVFAAVSLGLALTSFWAGPLAGLAGRNAPNFTLLAGFYLWLGAQALLPLWLWQRFRQVGRTETPAK
jgi:hypothetical protein